MAWETVAKVEVEEEEKPSNWKTVAKIDAEPEAEGATIGQGLTHLAKGYGKMGVGVADMPNMLSAAATWPTRKALNYMGVPEKYTDKAVYPSLSEQPGMDTANQWLDKTEGVEEGSGWDMGQTAVEWGGLGPVSAVRGTAKAIPDLAMAAGATLGEYLGGDLGEVAGGLTGMLSLLRGRSKNKGLDLIEEGSEDADAMLARVKEADSLEEAGTLADLSQEQGVADVEALVSGGESRRQYDNIELERQAQIAEEVRVPFGGGDAGTAAEAGQRRIDQIYDEVIPRAVQRQESRATVPLRAEQEAVQVANEVPQAAAVEAGLNQARAQERAGVAAGNTVDAARLADEAKAVLATQKTLAQASADQSGLFNTARAEQKAESVTPHWNEFDELPAIDVTVYKNTVKEFADALPPSQKKKFTEVSDSFSALKDKKISEMSPKEVQDILLDMRAVIDRAYKGGKVSTNIKNLEKLWKKIDAQLVDEIPSYKEAKIGETALRTRFDQGVVGDSRTLEPELFSKAIGQGDEAGAVASRYLAAADIPGMPEAQGEFLKALAQRSTKGVDEVFMKEYESMMSTLTPELQQQARALIDADKALEVAGAAEEAATKTAGAAGKQADATATAADVSTRQTAKETARLERAIAKEQEAAVATGKGLERTAEKSITNRYIKNRKTTILNSLKNPDDVTDLKALMRSMERLGETDSLNANIGDVILEKLSVGGAEAGLAKASDRAAPLTAKAIDDFQVMADSLAKAGVDHNVIQQTWQALYKLGTKQQKANARKVVFGSDRAAGQFLDSAAGAAALRILPGSSLIMGGAIRKVFARLGGSGDKRILAAIDDFMLNPDQYIMAAEEARNPTEAANTIAQEIVAASQAMAVD